MILAFDLDGTLITAEQKQTFLLKAVAARYEIHLNCNEIWQAKTSGLSNSKFLQNLGIKEKFAIAICEDWAREIETSFWLGLDSLFDDSLNTLRDLKDSGIHLALVTARQNKYLMRHQLMQLGIDRFFDKIHCVSPQTAVQEKRDALKAIHPLAFFGDSETDFNAACLAEVPFFAVCTGQRSKEFLFSHCIPNIHETIRTAVKTFLDLTPHLSLKVNRLI
jgi:phosphoglycolate phosphatase-like HAD superfamily hydrolase